jgi:hypothetical protein
MFSANHGLFFVGALSLVDVGLINRRRDEQRGVNALTATWTGNGLDVNH